MEKLELEKEKARLKYTIETMEELLAEEKAELHFIKTCDEQK